MAEQPNTSAAQMQVRVLGQYVKDLSFESPNMMKIMKEPPANPNLELEINVVPNKIGPDLYEAALTFKAEATGTFGTIYDLEMVYAGVFEIKNAPPEALDPMLNINCAALLFPFLRRLAADLTREGGFPPLLLDPVDFGALYMKKREAMQKAMPTGKPS
jgi:preprotein translocase subunit SecB